MKRIHAIAAATALFSLGCGTVLAQTVSGADPYVQGYAAGATAKERNSFEAFDKGYRAAQENQAAQDTMQNATTSALAYDKGYQAGIAASNARTHTEQQEAFNQGYTARGLEDRAMANRAFENGYDAGAAHRSYHDLDYP